MKKMLLFVSIVVSGVLNAYNPGAVDVRPVDLEPGPVALNKPLLKLQIPQNVDRITHKNLLEIKNKIHTLVERYDSLSDADKKQIAEHVKAKIMKLKEKIHALPEVQKEEIVSFILQLKHALMTKIHTFLKLHKETLTPQEEHNIAQAVRTLGPVKMALIKTAMELKHPGITHGTSGLVTGNYGHATNAAETNTYGKKYYKTAPVMNLQHE